MISAFDCGYCMCCRAEAANLPVPAVPADPLDLRRPGCSFERWCDCPEEAYHRWNCEISPIYAQVIRDLDTHPWTVFQLSDEVAMASALNGEWT